MMKPYQRLKLFRDKVEVLLGSTKDIDLAKKQFESFYSDLIEEYPLANRVMVSDVVTEKLRNSIFYQTPPNWMSDKSIAIDSGRFYLWLEQDKWCLNDEHYDVASISDELAQSEMLHRDPDTVRDLVELIVANNWKFSSERLPKFGGPKPNDLIEVLSWDERNILTGTTKENMSIVTRAEWTSIVSRESDWFGD
jgi:hypothetical protein